MEPKPPSQVTTAAVAQLVSGLLNIFVFPAIGVVVIGGSCGLLTIFLGGCGSLVGFLALLLVPIGIAEVVAGILGLANPKTGVSVMRIVGYVELASILFGGLISAVVGGVVSFVFLRAPEVEAYLTDSQQL